MRFPAPSTTDVSTTGRLEIRMSIGGKMLINMGKSMAFSPATSTALRRIRYGRPPIPSHRLLYLMRFWCRWPAWPPAGPPFGRHHPKGNLPPPFLLPMGCTVARLGTIARACVVTRSLAAFGGWFGGGRWSGKCAERPLDPRSCLPSQPYHFRHLATDVLIFGRSSGDARSLRWLRPGPV